MSTGYQVYDQYGTYYLTFSVVDWVDVFSRKIYRDIVIDSLKYCVSQKAFHVYGYVIMTNHIHIIIRSGNGKLSDTIRDFKKYTSRSIIEAIQQEPESRREWLLHRCTWNAMQNERSSTHQLWTHENHAMEITTQPFFRQKLDYIHQNPVRAGWVEREEDYIYSSAKALYTNQPGPFALSHWYD